MRYSHGGDIYTHENMLDFSVNVNPLGMSAHVEAAAKRGIEHSEAYPDSRCRKLRKKLADSQGLPEEYYIFGNGAAEIFYMLVLAEKPGQVLLPVPAFSEYERALHTVGSKIRYYYTKEENRFCIDEQFPDELNEEQDMIFLCSPGNPAGCMISRDLLYRTAERCEQLQIRLVLDECFVELIRKPDDFSMIGELRRYPHLVIVRAFTKTYAMPGLRLGYGITADIELAEKMERIHQPWSVSIPAQEAGAAALDETVRTEAARLLIAREKQFLEEQLDRMKISYISSDVNYILMRSEKDLFDGLKRRGILIRDCSDYRGLGKGWYRTAVRTHEDNLHLVRALKEITETEAAR